MQTFTDRCLCGQSHLTVGVEMLDIYTCHYTLCQKWSGGIAMYLEANTHPLMSPESTEPSHFPSSNRGERFFCSDCRCPPWFTSTDSGCHFIPWILLELNEVDRRRPTLAAEIYMEAQPVFWRLMGQYARSSGREVEEMDYPCHSAYQLLTLYLYQTEPHFYC